MRFLSWRNSLLIKLSTYLLAALFVFSGLSKGLNPFGLSIQLGEYFNALSISFLTPSSQIFAVLLPAAETLLGFMLLFGLAKRVTAWGVMILMCFFTILTLWISIANPVNDCGCFGDLLKIPNTATFVKNLLFMVPTIIVFIARNRNANKWSNSVIISVLAVFLSFVLPVYTTYNLPLIDATPFKIGVNIPQAMVVPAGAPQAIQQTILVYKNLETGREEKFEIDDTTWQNNPIYEFVAAQNMTMSEGFTPSIPTFPMLNRDGVDVSAELLLSDELFIIVAANVQDVDMQAFENLRSQNSVRIVILTSSSLSQLATDIEAYNSDFSLIRTMVQFPRGGALLLSGGTIVQKWSMADLPSKI